MVGREGIVRGLIPEDSEAVDGDQHSVVVM